MISSNKCKICRRAGVKLLLKGEKCLSPKCPFVKRSYPPGFQGKNKRSHFLSEYGKQLREKQKLRFFYNISERKFKSYIKKALKNRGGDVDNRELLIQSLEKRLDNVVYQLGLAESRPQARQLVSHGFFQINGKKVDIPSYRVDKGDIISIKPSYQKKAGFGDLKVKAKDYQVPVWLKMDIKKMEGEVTGEPNLESTASPADISTIFEFYSR